MMLLWLLCYYAMVPRLTTTTVSVVLSYYDATMALWYYGTMVLCFMVPRLTTTTVSVVRLYSMMLLWHSATSASEVFQRELDRILKDCPGCVVQMDDILIFGSNQNEHDSNLDRVLGRLQDHGLTVSKDKLIFNTSKIEFVGQLITADGIKPLDSKVRAITDMNAPNNLKELRRFLGMVNQLSKHVT